MITNIGDNIISPLGFTTEENFLTVEIGVSGIKHYSEKHFGLSEDFAASLIDKALLTEVFDSSFKEKFNSKTMTVLEKAAVLSIFLANKKAKVDLSSKKTLFIISTTKGNVDLLDTQPKSNLQMFLWYSGKQITHFFKNPNTPIVVSNACISGASAQIAAMRSLKSTQYQHAVVIGIDFLSKFIISGFQSFKALSPEICRPFDKNRMGLNLGEGVATIIYEKGGNEEVQHISLIRGAVRNDANHISGPSRTGEGSFRALNFVLKDINPDQIAFINAHGTATPYNDAMEAAALTRAKLENVPVNSLKPFFGHTLGAAGILESIISMRALKEYKVLQSLNFENQDFENKINVSKSTHSSNKRYFIKMLSGFGGCNAVLLFERVS